MKRDELRLECIKLAVARTHEHKDALARAEDYVSFVIKESPQQPSTTPDPSGAEVTAGKRAAADPAEDRSRPRE